MVVVDGQQDKPAWRQGSGFDASTSNGTRMREMGRGRICGDVEAATMLKHGEGGEVGRCSRRGAERRGEVV